MVQKVTLTYSSPGLRPPVYVTTSLSEPQWEILEMDTQQGADGQYHFEKVFHAKPGEYQYKFRLGPGDWWVCDEGKEVVDDGMGNRNNLIFVDEVKTAPVLPSEPMVVGQAKPAPDVLEEPQVQPIPQAPGPVKDKNEHTTPLLAHESHSAEEKVEAPLEDVPVNISNPRKYTLSLPGHGNYSDDEGDVEPSDQESSPLFRHETGMEPLQTTHDDRTPGAYEYDEDVDSPPLLTHESLAPTSHEQSHAPLFAHEAAQIGDHTASHNDDDVAVASPLSHHSDPIPAEALDLHDPSLEHFPTSHQGILGSIRRASLRLAEDETTEESLASPSSPSTLAKSLSHTQSASPSLPSVQENEEEEAERSALHQEHVAQPQPKGLIEASQSVASNFAQGLQILADGAERPASLMTPPRTPEEEQKPALAEPPKEAPHKSDHHHEAPAERDMADEAAHNVSHGEEPDSSRTADAEATEEDGSEATKKEDVEEEKPAVPGLVSKPKSLFGSSVEAVLGMGVTLAIGALAVWVAWKVQGSGLGDTVKDGGATLHG